MASLWEMAIKSSIGKLDVPDELASIVPPEITLFHIEVPHLQKVKELPLHHKDPFDRLIISQALVEDFFVMTDDPNFKHYGVKLI